MTLNIFKITEKTPLLPITSSDETIRVPSSHLDNTIKAVAMPIFSLFFVAPSAYFFIKAESWGEGLANLSFLIGSSGLMALSTINLIQHVRTKRILRL